MIINDICKLRGRLMKVWAKVMKADKILRDVIYEDNLTLSKSDYHKLLQELAYRLDISAPVTLPNHIKHFEKFNRIKYLPRDFIEEVDFDTFIIERVQDEKKTKLYLNY